MSVAVNAGPLIALGKLGLIDLLAALYGPVLVAPTVCDEVVVRGTEIGATDALQTARAIMRGDLVAVPSEALVLSDDVAALPLDAGEMGVIQLALDRAADLVLLDDQLARAHAVRLGIRVKGTVGVLIDAYRAGRLTMADLTAVFETIAHRDDIWIGEGLLNAVREQLRATSDHGD